LRLLSQPPLAASTPPSWPSRDSRAIQGATDDIEWIVKSGDRIKTVRFDDRDGLRYPRLERIAEASARLDEILAPAP
jgi:hypothetical protein